MEAYFEVGLFQWTPKGTISMVGASRDPGLICSVKAQIAAEKRQRLAQLEQPVRLVRPPEEEGEAGGAGDKR